MNKAADAPSAKQMQYLDKLALLLGFRSGRAYMAHCQHVESYGLLTYNSRAVSKSIKSALEKLALHDRRFARYRARHSGTAKPAGREIPPKRDRLQSPNQSGL